LNARLVEAIVKLRLRDCRKRLLIDEAMIEDARRAVTARLAGVFGPEPPDPLEDLALNMIEGEVEVEIAKPGAVAALACLNALGLFDNRTSIRCEFTDPATRSAHFVEQEVRGVYTAFPFSRVFDSAGLHRVIVSEQGRLVLAVFARVWGCPEVRFELVPPPGETFSLPVGPQLLPEGWGLSATEGRGRG
jgi:hypothetical protein